MMNTLIEQLQQLIQRYGTTLPPIEERRVLWLAITAAEASKRKEFMAFVDSIPRQLHQTMLGEIGRITADYPD